MAQFEALREGFHELNRMLTDRQTFNAQNEAREAKDVRDNTLLASQLEDKAFNQALKEKTLLMGQDMNQFNKDIANKKFEQSEHKFDVESKLAAQVAAEQAKSAGIERDYKSTLKDKANQAIKENNSFFSPVDVNTLFEGSGMGDAPPEVQDKVADDMFGGLVKRDEDGNMVGIIGRDGEPIKMSASEARMTGAGARLDGMLVDYKTSRKENSMKRIQEINKTIGQLNAKAKSQDVRMVTGAAEARAQIESLKSELIPLDEDMGLGGTAKDIDEKIEAKQRQAMYLRRLHKKDDADMVEAEIKILSDNRAAVQLERSKPGKGGKTRTQAAYKVDPNTGRVLDVQMVTMNSNAPGTAKPWSGGRDHLKDWVWDTKYKIDSKADLDNFKMFKNQAETTYGLKNTDTGLVSIEVENQELYNGLMQTQLSMMKNPKFESLNSQEVSLKAPKEHAENIANYFIIEDFINRNETYTPEEREAKLEELVKDTEEVLGDIPSREALDMLIERKMVNEGRVPSITRGDEKGIMDWINEKLDKSYKG